MEHLVAEQIPILALAQAQNMGKHRNRPGTILACLSLLAAASTTAALSQFDSSDWTRDVRDFWQRKPAASISYGITNVSWRALNFSIPNPGIGELRLGRIRQERDDDSTRLVSNRYDFLSLVSISHALGAGALEGDANLTIWRLGLGHHTGHGYELGPSSAEHALLFYTGDRIDWSLLKVRNKPALPADSALLALYENTFRFGISMEAGAGFQVTKEFEITVAYEREVVYRRCQFGKWLGSVVTEGAGQWVVDHILRPIRHWSPQTAPVIRFLLKNGLSFAFYQLRRDQMFFPFSSESPLSDDSFTVGMTVVL